MNERNLEEKRKCWIKTIPSPLPSTQGETLVRRYEFDRFTGTFMVPETYAEQLSNEESPYATPEDYIAPIEQLPSHTFAKCIYLLDLPAKTETPIDNFNIAMQSEGYPLSTYPLSMAFYQQRKDNTIFGKALAQWAVLVANHAPFSAAIRAYQLAKEIESGIALPDQSFQISFDLFLHQTPEFAIPFASDLVRFVSTNEQGELRTLAKQQVLVTAALSLVLELCLRDGLARFEQPHRKAYASQIAVGKESIIQARKQLLQMSEDKSLPALTKSNILRLLIYLSDSSTSYKLNGLNSLLLNNEYYLDENLLCIQSLTDLEELNLSMNPNLLSNNSILNLPKLKKLSMVRNHIDEEFIEDLCKLQYLEDLDLSFTPLSNLYALSLQFSLSLKKLDITGCNLSDETIEQLKRKLVNCEIAH